MHPFFDLLKMSFGKLNSASETIYVQVSISNVRLLSSICVTVVCLLASLLYHMFAVALTSLTSKNQIDSMGVKFLVLMS